MKLEVKSLSISKTGRSHSFFILCTLKDKGMSAEFEVNASSNKPLLLKFRSALLFEALEEDEGAKMRAALQVKHCLQDWARTSDDLPASVKTLLIQRLNVKNPKHVQESTVNKDDKSGMTKEQAQAFLQRAGIIGEDNELAPEYRTPRHPDRLYNERGQVAVLVSPGFGAGWSTWNRGDDYTSEQLMFDKELAEAILHPDPERRFQVAARKFPDAYTGGLGDLVIEWLDPGTDFTIEEYDGNESLVLKEHDSYTRAY